jgi:hypothetical protein
MKVDFEEKCKKKNLQKFLESWMRNDVKLCFQTIILRLSEKFIHDLDLK